MQKDDSFMFNGRVPHRSRLEVVIGLLALGALQVGCPSSVNTSASGGSNSGGSGAQGGTGGEGGAACVPGQEICDGKDNDCNDQVDDVPGGCACTNDAIQDCYSGAAGTDGVGVCTKGSQPCVDGKWGECAGEVIPEAEKCNNTDDDCNGLIDDMGQMKCGIGACEVTVETCVNGSVTDCIPNPPQLEICDGIDNNCNQLVDENVAEVGQSCMTGSSGVCAIGKYECTTGKLLCAGTNATTEVCDGLDNDCDGTIDDNIPGTGGTCSTGAPGVCSPGLIACAFSGGIYQIDCFSIIGPSTEVCDGKDNNCDGQNDEGDPGGGAVCDSGQPGICGPGVLHCVGGMVICVPNQTGTPETCNGIDDNCDGQIDEGNPGGGINCTTSQPGICSAGTTSCTNSSIVCNQNVMATIETCNGVDDDCDGVPDDGNPGGGAFCATGLQGVCAPGTITCQNAQLGCKQDVLPSAEVCGNATDENCDGVAVAAPTVYFNEPFANNNAGWTLGANWSIGPTLMSAPNTSCGIGDPALDHTPTADNGVAGNVLGGNISTAIGGPYYLTSPIINTAAAPTLFLEYYRWLHSDYPSFMFDRVEVFNGTAWIQVWINPNSTVINDTVWTKMSHDVTAYKNAQFRVRFSYQIGGTGVFTCAGWNIDDVQLVNAQCN